jgi:hypothetical protein
VLLGEDAGSRHGVEEFVELKYMLWAGSTGMAIGRLQAAKKLSFLEVKSREQ